MTKMYEPRELHEIGEEALFYVTDYLNPGNPQTPRIKKWFKKQSHEHNIRHRYSHGDCQYFAAVVHLILGCPILQIEGRGSEKCYHYAVEIDGKIMDINGFITKEELAVKYFLYGIVDEDKTDIPKFIKETDKKRIELTS